MYGHYATIPPQCCFVLACPHHWPSRSRAADFFHSTVGRYRLTAIFNGYEYYAYHAYHPYGRTTSKHCCVSQAGSPGQKRIHAPPAAHILVLVDTVHVLLALYSLYLLLAHSPGPVCCRCDGTRGRGPLSQIFAHRAISSSFATVVEWVGVPRPGWVDPCSSLDILQLPAHPGECHSLLLVSLVAQPCLALCSP